MKESPDVVLLKSKSTVCDLQPLLGRLIKTNPLSGLLILNLNFLLLLLLFVNIIKVLEIKKNKVRGGREALGTGEFLKCKGIPWNAGCLAELIIMSSYLSHNTHCALKVINQCHGSNRGFYYDFFFKKKKALSVLNQGARSIFGLLESKRIVSHQICLPQVAGTRLLDTVVTLRFTCTQWCDNGTNKST